MERKERDGTPDAELGSCRASRERGAMPAGAIRRVCGLLGIDEMEKGEEEGADGSLESMGGAARGQGT